MAAASCNTFMSLRGDATYCQATVEERLEWLANQCSFQAIFGSSQGVPLHESVDPKFGFRDN